MANESESVKSGREAGAEKRNPRTEKRPPIRGGQVSREEEKGGRAGGEGYVSQQNASETDDGGPSQQTSGAQDESGQL